jgi:predicted nucleotidyltransferase
MAEPVIVWNERDPLFGRSPEEFEAELRSRLAGRVEAAYIFGSYGTPDFGRDSDVDLMLVVRTEKPLLDRSLDFPELFELVPDLDLLVYTPEEFASLTADPSPGFWRSATESFRRII